MRRCHKENVWFLSLRVNILHLSGYFPNDPNPFCENNGEKLNLKNKTIFFPHWVKIRLKNISPDFFVHGGGEMLLGKKTQAPDNFCANLEKRGKYALK